MKTFKLFYIFFMAAYLPVAHSDDLVSGSCEQSIKSVIAIGNQLKQNPKFKKEDLDPIVNGLTQNLKIKEFLKIEILPRLINPNPNILNDFISNKENIARCTASIN
jgi:hypothetical protein